MCTVTIVTLKHREPAPDALAACVRMACNRDELRTRPPASLPVVRLFGDRRAIMPVDPVSDGTWIAVNDAGVAATLLNVNLVPRSQADSANRKIRSRGSIVPSLMHHARLSDAVRAARAIDPRSFPPFRLVILDDRETAEIHSDGQKIRGTRQTLRKPAFFTSSGLGDHLVDAPRRELFHTMFDNAVAAPDLQDRFHHHVWPDRRHLSVCMSRVEAETVNYTVVEIALTRVALIYRPRVSQFDSPTQLELERWMAEACLS